MLRKTLNVEKTAEQGGRPYWDYYYEGPEDGSGHVFKTGPVAGSIQLSDGTVYNVTEDYIEVEPHHAGPLNHHIAMMHEQSGALNGPGFTFVHECDDNCGNEADPARMKSGKIIEAKSQEVKTRKRKK